MSDLVAIFPVFISFSANLTPIEMIYEIRDTINENPYCIFPYLSPIIAKSHMKYLKLILSILFIFCLTRTYADDSNYLFRHYQVENGLSDNMATCCVQDGKGYVWIGTV